jgi:hypothetical protein
VEVVLGEEGEEEEEEEIQPIWREWHGGIKNDLVQHLHGLETERRVTKDGVTWSVLEGERGELELLVKIEREDYQKWMMDCIEKQWPSYYEVWRIQEVLLKIAAALPRVRLIGYMSSEWIRRQDRKDYEIRTCLVLTCPMLDVFNITFTADIDIFTGFYEHITGRGDIGYWRKSRIISC